MSIRGTGLVELQAVLTEEQAEALAQFCKRITFDHFRTCAVSTAEAYAMRDALLQVQTDLSLQGFNPR